jgi:hypothetical protein
MFEIKIEPNKKWQDATEFFSTVMKRYDWFLFEFGRLITRELYKNLLNEIKGVKGPKDYQKRLVMAEIRDRGGKAWFAVAVRAINLHEAKKDADHSILKVVSRFPDLKGFDPVRDILQTFGPWTVDTIPFVPPERAAIVTIQAAKIPEVNKTRAKNKASMAKVQKIMAENNLSFDTRIFVMRKLKVVENFEKWVNDLEFGISGDRRPHWGPAIKKTMTSGLRKLMRDKGLMNVLTDPSFKQYNVKHHLNLKMTDQEVKDLEKFRKRLLKSL